MIFILTSCTISLFFVISSFILHVNNNNFQTMSNATFNPEEISCPDGIYSNYTRHFIYITKAYTAWDYVKLCLGTIGCILNLIILIVFYAKKLTTRFERILSTYSFVSFTILAIYSLSIFFNFNFYTTVGFYMRVAFHSALFITISFNSFLDTYMIYERIQLYKPHMKFMLKISFVKLSLVILLLAVLVNIHETTLLLNRYAFHVIDSKCNATARIQSYYFQSHAFRIICYVTLVSKFVFNLIVDLVLTIYLLRIVRHFHRYKTGLKILACSKMRSRTKERYNTIIAVVLCLITTVLSLITVIDKFFNIQVELLVIKTSLIVFNIAEYFIMFKYSINFFLFYFLNRKFRKCVNRVARVFACCCR